MGFRLRIRLLPNSVAAATVLFFNALNGCDGAERTVLSPPAVIASPAPSMTSSAEPASDCMAQWTHTLGETRVEDSAGLGANRARLLSRAKAEPILFLSEPHAAKSESASVRDYRRHLAEATRHWDALNFVLRRFVARPDIGRQVLLKDGYLYAKHPHMAYAFEQLVQPEHLFDTPRIWVQRGHQTLWAKRDAKGLYYYESTSAAEPQRVNLLHLDRIGSGAPSPPLHVDLRELRDRLHFDRVSVEHQSQSRVLATLHFGPHAVRAVLLVEGARLRVQCEEAGTAELRRSRQQAQQRAQALTLLQWAMHDQVVDALPFDEPRKEQGNEDGVLRHRWERAYFKGRGSFRFGEIDYEVFNRAGNPRPPQVCVDFLSDTFERASGTWWTGRTRPRRRLAGRLDLGTFPLLKTRRVPDLLKFAESKPEWFEVHSVPPEQRIPFRRRNRFFKHLREGPAGYQRGDIVVVRGYTPSDREHMHYHSFFIYETDPISGVPVAIVGNAGYPHIWSFEGEARRAPDRSVWHRLRPKLPLLKQVLGATEVTRGPAPLVEEAL